MQWSEVLLRCLLMASAGRAFTLPRAGKANIQQRTEAMVGRYV
jgi:hypothetical protein